MAIVTNKLIYVHMTHDNFNVKLKSSKPVPLFQFYKSFVAKQINSWCRIYGIKFYSIIINVANNQIEWTGISQQYKRLNYPDALIFMW